MSDWEATFTSWAKGPGTTEQAKCENAETAIRKAIAAHEKLSVMDITVFGQGSYRNKTNVRQNSDVDICVRLNSTFFCGLPHGNNQRTIRKFTG
jgi:tRNA nucleotidyltransferase (CCA-adding enzyme)